MDNHHHHTAPIELNEEYTVAAEQTAGHDHGHAEHGDSHTAHNGNHAAHGDHESHDGHHADHTGSHTHDHRESLRRLKSAEGHLRGIQRMLENDVYCIDVIRQIQAVQAALNKVSVHILNQHLNTCVITAVRGEDPAERERVLKEIAEIYDMATKV